MSRYSMGEMVMLIQAVSSEFSSGGAEGMRASPPRSWIASVQSEVAIRAHKEVERQAESLMGEDGEEEKWTPHRNELLTIVRGIATIDGCISGVSGVGRLMMPSLISNHSKPLNQRALLHMLGMSATSCKINGQKPEELNQRSKQRSAQRKSVGGDRPVLSESSLNPIHMYLNYQTDRKEEEDIYEPAAEGQSITSKGVLKRK